MRRRSSVTLEVKQDRWLVSYADFITLLFAFFVVMYSISHVSEGKYKVLSNTLMEAFSVTESAIKPIQVGEPTRSTAPSAIESDNEPQPIPDTAANTDDANLDHLEQLVNKEFVDLIDDSLLSVKSNELWLELELNSNILFPTASADPSLQAKGIFEEVASMLAAYNNIIQVEGFTDDVPINNNRFKSNWELSAARAASVVKLLARNGVSPERLSAVGRGEFQPVADNSTAAGRARNRRVVVMVSKAAKARPTLTGDDVQTVLATDTDDTVSSGDTQTINLDEPDLAAPTPELEVDDALEQTPKIEPIQLDNGGLLFSSDPDLPRENAPVEQP